MHDWRRRGTCPTRDVIQLGDVLVHLWLSSYCRAARAATLDIDDTLDVVHCFQHQSLFNAHYDERALCRLMSMTPPPPIRLTAKEIRGHLRQPTIRILVRAMPLRSTQAML
ncbi:transposase [Mesorhizobium sp. M0913]|uniref:transposase n=1 Tax=Mesorhizobium sp. M0913 TaxID=2957026 RepID=UPI00333AD017